jgi:gluconokinase
VVSDRIPNLLFLFGVSGAGKTFVGDLVSRKLGYFHYDLDQDLTPAMRAAIAAKRSFTEAERDEYFEVVRARINEVATLHSTVVFTQGAYKERHREFLRKHIPLLRTIWIKAPHDVIHERLRTREGGVSADYADTIERNFEAPLSGMALLNDAVSVEELWERFDELFRRD